MSLKNASVTLTIPLQGVLTSKGIYEYKERTTTGSILSEDQRLFIIKKPQYSDCFKKIELSESFVNFAISDHGRPSIGSGFKAHTFWQKFSETERLFFHLAKYAFDFGTLDFNYTIHEE